MSCPAIKPNVECNFLLHYFYSIHLQFAVDSIVTRNPAIAEGPRDAGVPVEIW